MHITLMYMGKEMTKIKGCKLLPDGFQYVKQVVHTEPLRSFRINFVPRYYSIARPRVQDGGNGLLMKKVPAIKLNKVISDSRKRVNL
jgi:hypothetical protein